MKRNTRPETHHAGAAMLQVAMMAAMAVLTVSNTASADTFALTRIADGVYVHQGHHAAWSGQGGADVANLGVIIGRDCAAIIDTGGTPDVGQALLNALHSQTDVPVCYVINTHGHPDHVLGNHIFAQLTPRPRFVGHARLGAALNSRGPYYLNTLKQEFALTPAVEWLIAPDIEVGDTFRLDLGGRNLTLKAWPTAHTDQDLTVLDEASGTLFAGDLIFDGHLPVIDGKLVGWLSVMDALGALDVKQVVPGHGKPATDIAVVMAPQRRYLESMLHELRAAIAAGRTISETVDSIAPPKDDGWQLIDNFHRRNLTAAYAEIEWE